MSRLSVTKQMKNFLETVQPLDVKYGYSRGVVENKNYLTYKDMSTNMRKGIGNKLISKKVTFMVTVQTETATSNLIYSSMIQYGTDGTAVSFIADDLRRDITVENGWINTIILTIFSSDVEYKQLYTRYEVREILQNIANHYIFVTNIYEKTLVESWLDKLVAPDLEDKSYTYDDILQLKREYIDRFILLTDKY